MADRGTNGDDGNASASATAASSAAGADAAASIDASGATSVSASAAAATAAAPDEEAAPPDAAAAADAADAAAPPSARGALHPMAVGKSCGFCDGLLFGRWKRCGGCKSVFYCCAEHAVAHWPAHREACQAEQARLEAAACAGGLVLGAEK